MNLRGDFGPVLQGASLLTEDDLHLFSEGRHYRLHEKMGSRLCDFSGQSGTHFSVWAPGASAVSVIGEWNDWNGSEAALSPRTHGIWEGFIPGVRKGFAYKYRIQAEDPEKWGDKADPFAVFAEQSPGTASLVWDLDYQWGDASWILRRQSANEPAPQSVYELHLGSWRRPDGVMPSYREIADSLIEYLLETEFTHVEFLPLMEHPFYASWGYQATGYFAATSRYGTPQDLMYLVDRLHQAAIGVFFDWVPSHFPTDEHGLVFFDGTHLFEDADPTRGWHPDWKSCIFDYQRPQVRSFLISSALYWIEVFHGDGLRVDAVSSMIYLNYSRLPGEWSPNRYGGNENLDAIGFLRELNEEVARTAPGAWSIAEESTSWPMVTRPTYLGGLGFQMKWDMGWMNDTLSYLRHDPLFRRYRHDRLTFRMMYAFNERFALALSHDEVVHGKRSLLSKMPGDREQQLANLRLLFGYQWGLPGKKLLFMGGEFGQLREWDHDRELSWHLLEDPKHRGVQRWVRDLNRLYRSEPALHSLDHESEGFSWIDCSDAEAGVISWLRIGEDGVPVLVVCNLTPVTRTDYGVGVPRAGVWRELLNSDAESYGGRGRGNYGQVRASAIALHGQIHSLALTLPGLSALFLAPVADATHDFESLFDSIAAVEAVGSAVGAVDSEMPPSRSGSHPTLKTSS